MVLEDLSSLFYPVLRVLEGLSSLFYSVLRVLGGVLASFTHPGRAIRRGFSLFFHTREEVLRRGFSLFSTPGREP